jgi:deoxyribonuclease-4
MSHTAFRFGTVGSPLSTPKKPGGSVGAISRLAEMGLDALELGWVQSVRVGEQTCLDIRANGEGRMLKSASTPYFINLNAEDEEWPKSRKRLMDAAHYGNLAGATDIIFHPGSNFGLPPEQVLPKAIERLRGCVEELRLAGNPVILRPETMGKSAMLGSFEDTLEMSRLIPGVEPCLDFAHLHARPGDGTMNTYAEWARLVEAYGTALGAAALGDLHVHLSGIEYGPKGEKEHCRWRSRPGPEGALPRYLRLRLPGPYPVRKPGNGRRRADPEAAMGRNGLIEADQCERIPPASSE